MSESEDSGEEGFEEKMNRLENGRIQRCIDSKNNFLDEFEFNNKYCVPDGESVKISKVEVEGNKALKVMGLTEEINNAQFTIDKKMSRMDHPNGCLYFFDSTGKYRLVVDVFSINSLFTVDVREEDGPYWKLIRGFAVLTKKQYDDYCNRKLS